MPNITQGVVICSLGLVVKFHILPYKAKFAADAHVFSPNKKSGLLIQKRSTFKYDGTQHLLNPSHQLIINMPTHLIAASLTIPECSYHNTDVTPYNTAALCIYFTRSLPHSFTHPVEKVQGFAGVQAAAEGDEDSGVGSPNCTSSQARGPEPAHHHGNGVRKGREGSKKGRKEGRGRRTGNRRRRKSRVSGSKTDGEVKKSKHREIERETERGAETEGQKDRNES